jgi:glycosyltransferase involved in cell wall biosynthesis
MDLREFLRSGYGRSWGLHHRRAWFFVTIMIPDPNQENPEQGRQRCNSVLHSDAVESEDSQGNRDLVGASIRTGLKVELLKTFISGKENEGAHSLSLNRVERSHMEIERLLGRANKIMGEHEYVHFSLQDGRAVHLSKLRDGVIIHAVNPGVLPKEVRYTNIQERTFLSMEPDNIETVAIEDGVLERTDVILNDLEIFLTERAQRPLIVQVSPQGYHENDLNKLKLGLQDTGGQDKYINDCGDALTTLGYNVLNVNRAGPNHPKNGDVREGMHYSYTGMDLLFVRDGLLPEDARFGKFIPKEKMYPYDEWEKDGLPPADPIFFGMALNLVQHLLREPQRRDFTLIGHYADGGTVAWHTARILEQMYDDDPILKGSGFKVPKVWYNAHSLGVLKQRALEGAGEHYDPDELRFPVRHRFEQFLYDHVDGVISTSDTMTESMENDFGRQIDYFLPPGIDTNQFHPRPKNVQRTDPRYDDVWSILAKLSNQSKETLSSACLLMEVSRTAETKGKIDVLRAFSAALTDEDKQRDGKFLIINIADPNRPGIQEAERVLASRLHKEIERLGIHRWVITQNDFSPPVVAKLHQMTDIFITGAVSEPWGMSLQQAAASRQVVISTTRVPSGFSVLLGDEPVQVRVEGSEHPMLIGEGAIFVEPTDWNAAAQAIKHVAENPELAKAMAKRAFHRVIPQYTWNNMTATFVQDAFGHQLDGTGTIDWPKDSALLSTITRPRYV